MFEVARGLSLFEARHAFGFGFFGKPKGHQFSLFFCWGGNPISSHIHRFRLPNWGNCASHVSWAHSKPGHEYGRHVHKPRLRKLDDISNMAQAREARRPTSLGLGVFSSRCDAAPSCFPFCFVSRLFALSKAARFLGIQTGALHF